MKWKLVMTFFIITLAATQTSTAEDNIAGTNHSNRKLSRKPRALGNPLVDFFGPIFELLRIHAEQKNDTEVTLTMVHDVLADSFADTYIPKIPLPSDDAMNANVTTSSTTEKYRETRHEYGRILARNYLGLQRLFAIELDDAKNQSQYSIAELEAYNESQDQKKALKF